MGSLAYCSFNFCRLIHLIRAFFLRSFLPPNLSSLIHSLPLSSILPQLINFYSVIMWKRQVNRENKQLHKGKLNWRGRMHTLLTQQLTWQGIFQPRQFPCPHFANVTCISLHVFSTFPIVTQKKEHISTAASSHLPVCDWRVFCTFHYSTHQSHQEVDQYQPRSSFIHRVGKNGDKPRPTCRVWQSTGLFQRIVGDSLWRLLGYERRQSSVPFPRLSVHLESILFWQLVKG